MLWRKIKEGKGAREHRACVCICHKGWSGKNMLSRWHLLKELKEVRGLTMWVSGAGAFPSETCAKVLG